MRLLQYLFVCFVLQSIVFSSYAQNQDFKVYVLPQRYDEADAQYFETNSLYDRYYWIGRAVLTPNRDGVVSEKSIRERLDLYFPNKNDGGVVSIDLEGEIMEDLKKYGANDRRFKKSEAIYLNMVNIVKTYRPNVKIGIYGMPFRYFNRNTYKEADDKKLYNIFSKVDYLSPSFYIQYPEIEKGKDYNTEYLKWNLDRTLKISKDVGKPLMPYVWHVVHPVNKKYGGKMMDSAEMSTYITYMQNYTAYGNKISGVLWWEEPQSSRYSFRKISSLSSVKSLSGEKSTNNNIIIEATKSLLK